MDVQLKELIDRIKNDGVKSAEVSAKEIILEAEKKAKDIILKAEKKATDLKDSSIREAELNKQSGISAVKQSARDLVIDLKKEIETIFNKLVPEDDPDYMHVFEGPDDLPAHIKSSMVGSFLTIPIENGKMGLGTWQGIYLGEFRNNAAGRRIICTLYY